MHLLNKQSYFIVRSNNVVSTVSRTTFDCRHGLDPTCNLERVRFCVKVSVSDANVLNLKVKEMPRCNV